jgi:uroporphyrinogen III methyltransferase/synthase
VTRVLITRPAGQAEALVAQLAALGIESVGVPTVAIEPASPAEHGTMVDALPGAAWLVVTSANGASALADALRGSRLPAGVRIAAVGPATAAVLERAGLNVDHVPPVYRTAEIAAGLGPLRGRRIALFRADNATPDLREALLRRGALVDEHVAYRVIEGPAAQRDRLHRALRGPLDGIAFTSGSTVRGLMRLASALDRPRARVLAAFCIGPVTADVARSRGFAVARTADEHTTDGLAAAIADHFAAVAR